MPGMPPRGIGVAVTVVTMLVGYGLIALFFTHLLPLFQQLPNGIFWFIIAFCLTYLIVAIMVYLVTHAARRSFVELGSFLFLQVDESTDAMSLLLHNPLIQLLMVAGIIAVIILALEILHLLPSREWLERKHTVEF